MPYRRRKRPTRDIGRDRARYHIAQAEAFSTEVGQTDGVVKDAFFALSRSSLEVLLAKYGELYGQSAEEYARDTFPKWKNYWQRRQSGSYRGWQSDEVQMSGMVAQRLFDLLPPLLPIEQKHKIVEAIWKAYGPYSRKYVYLGPDSEVDAVVTALEEHFSNQEILHGIPAKLEARFDWLSDHDVRAKQQLLNHFMNEQRKAAIASARLNIPMLLDQMRNDTQGQIKKLSHTVFVGNHTVEIKADPLRAGFLLSNSPRDAIRPPIKVPWVGLSIAAAVLVGYIVVTNSGQTSTSPTQASTSQNIQQVDAIQNAASTPGVLATSPPQTLGTASPVPRPATLKTPLLRRSLPPHVAFAPSNGCSAVRVASVNGDGTEVVLSNGRRYDISDAVMRMTAAAWATGNDVTLCTSQSGASLKVGYSSVQASFAGTSVVEEGSCRSMYIGFTTPSGAEIGTTDGSLFELVANEVSKMSAADWTTGQAATICTARHDGIWFAAVRVGYSEVQTTLTKAGSGAAREASCNSVTVDKGPGESGALRVGGNAYEIGNPVMRMTADEFVTGDRVVLCRYSSNGITYASITKGYSSVQATQL